MKQTTELTEAKKWWRQINGTHKQLALGKKYFSGLDSGLTDDQIEFIYSREVIAMQPQETASSNDSLELENYEFVKRAVRIKGEDSLLFELYGNTEYKRTKKDADNLAELITFRFNNYNALKQSNGELYNALAAILHASGIDDFNSIKPNHSKLTQQAIAALQKAKQL